ncbi:hypothetical protein [Sporomusa sp. KB1]|nr:hypothetical protein [Sporomusa sp. KB1]
MANKKPTPGNGSPRTSPTQSNHQVSNDTLSANDLQSSAHSSKERTKAGG